MSRAWLWTPARIERAKALIAAGHSVPAAADLLAAEERLPITPIALERALHKSGQRVRSLRAVPEWTPARINAAKALIGGGRTIAAAARELGVTRASLDGGLRRAGVRVGDLRHAPTANRRRWERRAA